METLESITRGPNDITDPLTNFDSMGYLQVESEGIGLMEEAQQAQEELGPEAYQAIVDDAGPEALPEGQRESYTDQREAYLRNQERLNLYFDNKQRSGSQPLEFADQVYARRGAQSEEELAKEINHMMTSDDESFKAKVKENGDTEAYEEMQSYVSDPNSVKDKYNIEYALSKSGFSASEIEDGSAEAWFRKKIGAGEHEPTSDAILHWSNDTNEKYQRRHDLTEASANAASRLALDMGSEFSFEEVEQLLKEDFPRLSNDERTELRQNTRIHYAAAKKAYDPVLSLVRKTFNTVAEQEGITSKFNDEGDEPFANLQEAVKEVGKLDDMEYDLMLAAMAETAKNHGMDAGNVFTKLGKNMSRGIQGIAMNSFTNTELRRRSLEAKSIKSALADYEGQVVEKIPRLDLPGEYEYHLKDEADSFRLPGWVTGNQKPEKTFKGREGLIEAQKESELASKTLQRSYKVRNWRETVAKVGSDNWLMDNWVYGLARSVPEMAVAMTGPAGMVLIANAQQERNMQQLRNRQRQGKILEDGKWRDKTLKERSINVDSDSNRRGALLGGLGYAVINRFQGKTLTKGMPKFKSKLAKFAGITGVETIQETGQDLTFGLAQELLSIVDEDVTEFEMTSEFKEAFLGMGEMALAMVPFGIIGTAGSAAMEYVDGKEFERSLVDADYRKLQGITDEMMGEMEGLTTPEKMDFIKENQAEIVAEMKQQVAQFEGLYRAMLEYSLENSPVNVITSEDGQTFSVTDGDVTLEAKSPKEAREAVLQLDPEFETREVETQAAPEGELYYHGTRGDFNEWDSEKAGG